MKSPDLNKIKFNAALLSFLVGIFILLLKFGGYFLTGSNIILSDAAESIIHVAATSFALYSVIVSSRPADKSHPYGHGKIEFISAGIEGLLIIFAALYIIYSSVLDIIFKPEIKNLETGIIFIAIAGVINLFLGFYLIKKGKKTLSLTLVADGKHVLTDSITSIGGFVGIVLVMVTGINLLDPVFAIILALNITYSGYKLLREAIGGIMNETDTDTLNKITEFFIEERKPYWIDIHEMRYWKSGNKIFIDFHLILPFYFSIKDSHIEEKNIKKMISEKLPDTQIKIHFDYCTDDLCKFCEYKECTFRKAQFEEKTFWNTDKLTGVPIYEYEND